jgi:hypothetical protein
MMNPQKFSPRWKVQRSAVVPSLVHMHSRKTHTGDGGRATYTGSPPLASHLSKTSISIFSHRSSAQTPSSITRAALHPRRARNRRTAPQRNRPTETELLSGLQRRPWYRRFVVRETYGAGTCLSDPNFMFFVGSRFPKHLCFT